MVATRRNRSSSPSEEGDSPAIEDSVSNSKVPVSDPSRAVKIVIAEKNRASLSMFRIRSPKGAPALYVISEDSCSEVVQVGGEYRSWFYGNDVVEDGSFRLNSPIHPLFLAIPYFYQLKDKFVELDEILTDPEFASIEELKKNKQLLRTLSSISESKEICDTVVYRFSQEKTLEWLGGRLQNVKKAVLSERSLHKSISSNDEVLDRFCFGLLCGYIPQEMVASAKEHLKIVDAAVSDGEKIETYKRKAEGDEFALANEPAAKKPRESAVKKQLAQASKGTKSISSFFSKK